jgi:hypothetical protein
MERITHVAPNQKLEVICQRRSVVAFIAPIPAHSGFLPLHNGTDFRYFVGTDAPELPDTSVKTIRAIQAFAHKQKRLTP